MAIPAVYRLLTLFHSCSHWHDNLLHQASSSYALLNTKDGPTGHIPVGQLIVFQYLYVPGEFLKQRLPVGHQSILWNGTSLQSPPNLIEVGVHINLYRKPCHTRNVQSSVRSFSEEHMLQLAKFDHTPRKSLYSLPLLCRTIKIFVHLDQHTTTYSSSSVMYRCRDSPSIGEHAIVSDLTDPEGVHNLLQIGSILFPLASCKNHRTTSLNTRREDSGQRLNFSFSKWHGWELQEPLKQALCSYKNISQSTCTGVKKWDIHGIQTRSYPIY